MQSRRHKYSNLYVQYGCGLSAPAGWLNFDASPTLQLQHIPFIGRALTRGRVAFPKGVQYGDVVRGLPLPDGSCAGVYASHVLEHLSLEDFRKALRETHRLLADSGRFRFVVPDLHASIKRYCKLYETGSPEASMVFMRDTMLGIEKRPHGLSALLVDALGHSRHFWMWDERSLLVELQQSGFQHCARVGYGDSADPAFRAVEDPDRFRDAVAIECYKITQ